MMERYQSFHIQNIQGYRRNFTQEKGDPVITLLGTVIQYLRFNGVWINEKENGCKKDGSFNGM